MFKKILLCVGIITATSVMFHGNVDGKEELCGIENCHGVDIACGSNIPNNCNFMYDLGDFCRQYARCEMIDGSCQFIKNETFDLCKSCVEQCAQRFKQDPTEAFNCESQCREEIEGNKETP